MAIQNVKVTREPNSYNGKTEDVGEPFHVGQVVALDADYNVRKMSDIWADDFYAVVWTGTMPTRVFLYSNFELQDQVARATIDATPEVLAAYKAWQEAQAEQARKAEQARCDREAAERAEIAAKDPQKGRRVRVVRGRNVPIGTEGVVIWRGSNDYGERVGIATSDRRDANGKNLDVVWTAVSNVEALPEGNSDSEVEDRLNADKQAWRKSKEVAQVSAATSAKSKWDAIFAAVADAKVPF